QSRWLARHSDGRRFVDCATKASRQIPIGGPSAELVQIVVIQAAQRHGATDRLVLGLARGVVSGSIIKPGEPLVRGARSRQFPADELVLTIIFEALGQSRITDAL